MFICTRAAVTLDPGSHITDDVIPAVDHLCERQRLLDGISDGKFTVNDKDSSLDASEFLEPSEQELMAVCGSPFMDQQHKGHHWGTDEHRVAVQQC